MDYYHLCYDLYYWHTSYGHEVDFIAYGEKGFHVFEIKTKNTLTAKDLSGLKQFSQDYPEAKLYVIYGGDRKLYIDNICAIPFTEALFALPELLAANT